jgi:porin
MKNSNMVAIAALAAALATPGLGFAADADGAAGVNATPPAFKLGLSETVDFLQNTRGGISVGGGVNNKLAVAATADGDGFGRPGFKAHLQIFNTNEGKFSAERSGDLQLVSNIEAPQSTRLFAAWVEQRFGDVNGVRFGLMDVNIDFDSIAPAGLFLNSSHGIGIDFSQTGPSIYPVSALGLRGIWAPSEQLTLTAAVFDGVSGDGNRPHDFVHVKVGGDEGALLIGQADWRLSQETQISIGGWRNTTVFNRLDPALGSQRGQGGVYGSIQGPVPIGQGVSGWLRLGVADSRVNEVGSYIGAGLVKSAPFGRKGDQVGIAMARAQVGGPARRLIGLPDAETSIEATYAFAVNDSLALQPDVQYIIHPASASNLKDALVVGLRLSLAFSTPAGTQDDED